MPLKLTTPSNTEIHIERVFNAPVAFVWRAFSEPEIVKQWLTGPPGHSMPVCEIDFKVGGKWRYVWSMPEGEMEANGVYKHIVSHEQIVHTETFCQWPDNETTVTTTFSEDAGRTTVVLKIEYDSQETRDAILQTPMEQGLEMSYCHLDEVCEAEQFDGQKN